jgi:hypothetical protein
MDGATTKYQIEEFKVFNVNKQIYQPKKQDKKPNQNRPMKEKQDTNADAQGLPLVAIESLKTQRKETRRRVPHLTLFQDHLVLESKPRFSIILRLENAGDACEAKAARCIHLRWYASAGSV